ncbi:MAG: glycosyltransferase family 2 protein [Ignavibacteria bacterium]|nr:glycosyltransferase family 2 protein [Ignavibacteria bacterium]
MTSPLELSIIIVNYNVKDFLSQCLNSILKSQVNFGYEIIVVDNNSSDNSIEFLQSHFPFVKIIPLKENKGFGFANNVGFENSQGRYILLLNPDTVLQEDTLQVMYDFMESNKDVGVAGCKVLNPDGSLQLACRRSVPTPWVAFTKLFGLQRLFPKSKLFGKYNLTYLNENEVSFVDSISGSFMFLRREVYQKLDGFDTNFFLFGEDLDFCYRAKQLGWKIAYVPNTSIIHYKGQSSKRSLVDTSFHFFKSMEIFTRKHFGSRNWFLWFIKLGIYFRHFISKIYKYKTELLFVLLDLLFANLSLLIASWIRFGNMLSFPDYAYPTVFIVLSVVVFLSMVSAGEYFEFKHSLWKTTFALLISFFILSSLTYFFKDFAFSRGVLLLTIGLTLLLTNTTRLVFNLKRKISTPRRIAFVGNNTNTKAIIDHLDSAETIDFELIGVILFDINQNCTNLPILGRINEISEIVELYDITEIIVTDEKITKIDMLEYLQKLEGKNIKIFYAQGYEDVVASELISSLTSKDNILYSYNLSLFRFRFFKRVFDLFLLLWFFTIGFPFLFLFFDKSKRKLKNFWKILLGEMTFVGLDKEFRQIFHKQPLITISEANSSALTTPKALEKLNLFYLQGYTPLLDLEILLKYKRGKDGKNTLKISA